MEWQLIETAPKDGTEIFVFCYDGIFKAVYLTEKDLEEVDSEDYENLSTGFYEKTLYNNLYDEYFYYLNPTHWMPLPKPPQQEEK